MSTKRITSATLATFALLLGLLTPLVTTTPAAALSGSDFDPGNIISDANFYNGSAMSEAQIQQFLENAVGTCSNSNCLAVYRADTPTRTWSFGTCSTYVGGAGESAARIIFKVQQACSLSAKVILVTLQKEQSLITDRAPTDGVMRKAMGYGCPDTSVCDSTYYGFFNQVFAAGRQLTWYGNPAGSFTSIRVGEYNSIRYHPNAGCGSKSVLVKSRATAALYYYTPYTPNAAALANLGGLGDACSAYGNRNFWVFYNNWFGATTGPDGAAAIAGEYAAQGGPAGHLGAPITAVVGIAENGGGLGQAFQNGSIYWSASTGALTVRAGALRDYYFRFNGAAGPMGWPMLNQQPIPVNGGGLGQLFTGGSLYSSAAGTFLVKGAIRDGYFAQNGAAGPLSWPAADQSCGLPAGACSQRFLGGNVYWTPTGGAFATWGAIDAAYTSSGSLGGSWGYPVSGSVYIGAAGGGYGQAYSKGSAYSQAAGAFFVDGAIRELYFANNGAVGRLGFPTSAKSCGPDGTCAQEFQYGAIMVSPAGAARIASPDIEAAYQAMGGASGVLGGVSGPLLHYAFNGGGLAQGYVAGAIFRKQGLGAFAVYGAIRDEYFAQGGAAGSYGWPKTGIQCGSPGGSCRQAYEGATVFWTSATGAHGVSAAILDSYGRAGGGGGAWGWPTTRTVALSGGSGQAFTAGSAYAAGGGTAYFVGGAIRDAYFRIGGATGSLGYPTADAQCGLPAGGCVQTFQRGSIYSASASGTHVVEGAFLSAYSAAGGPAGGWGYPLTSVVPLPYRGGGSGQAFETVSVYWSAPTGLHAVAGSIRDYYFTRGGAAGELGYPTGDANCNADGCSQAFQGGTVRASSTGAITLQ